MGVANVYYGVREGSFQLAAQQNEQLSRDQNSEWLDVESSLHIKESEMQTGYYEDHIEFSIRMKRNPVFYLMYLLIPSVLMAFVSVLVFLLPPESGERVGLSITVLLSYTVFLLMVSEMSPRGGENTSLLGKLQIN